MPSESNLPLTEQYRRVALAWVDAEAAASLLEDCKSSVLAERMQEHADLPINRAEAKVKASQEWKDFIQQMVDARKEANRHKVHLDYLKMRFQEEMSQQANERIEARL